MFGGHPSIISCSSVLCISFSAYGYGTYKSVNVLLPIKSMVRHSAMICGIFGRLGVFDISFVCRNGYNAI